MFLLSWRAGRDGPPTWVLGLVTLARRHPQGTRRSGGAPERHASGTPTPAERAPVREQRNSSMCTACEQRRIGAIVNSERWLTCPQKFGMRWSMSLSESGPDLLKSQGFFRIRVKIGRYAGHSGGFGRDSLELGQFGPTFDQSRAGVAQDQPDSASIRQSLGPMWTSFWARSINVGPDLAEIAHTCPGAARMWVDVGRMWHELRQIWPDVSQWVASVDRS